METLNRPSWDDIWMQVSLTMAQRAKCSRAAVGSVIVSADQRVVSTGYNGPPSGYLAVGSCSTWCPRSMKNGQDASPTYDDCPSVHAEMNAIIRADPQELKGATVYTTSSICRGCAKVVANSGATRVVHLVNDELYWYRHNDETEKFLEECGIEVLRWTQDIREETHEQTSDETRRD